MSYQDNNHDLFRPDVYYYGELTLVELRSITHNVISGSMKECSFVELCSSLDEEQKSVVIDTLKIYAAEKNLRSTTLSARNLMRTIDPVFTRQWEAMLPKPTIISLPPNATASEIADIFFKQ
jgi:hypothetical protein